MNVQPKYLFYATLLDGYQNYLSSNEIYQKYWGFSENPEFTEQEFEEKQFQNLIDRINRVPFDSEAADQGTAFNEIVDCMILNKKSNKMVIEKICNQPDGIEPNSGEPYNENLIGLRAKYKERVFDFPIELCREFANYYKGAIPQVRAEAILSTKYGDVMLYGDIDELMPTSINDIKTTRSYSTGDFKKHWQHVVYPFCLNQNGNSVKDFEYNIAAINRTKYSINYSTHTEYYAFNPDIDIPRLKCHIEGLIEFIETNRELITDKKIFNFQ